MHAFSRDLNHSLAILSCFLMHEVLLLPLSFATGHRGRLTLHRTTVEHVSLHLPFAIDEQLVAIAVLNGECISGICQTKFTKSSSLGFWPIW
ncbi:hypothetical protein BD310DRAFT_632367 [Dichomitus squalens]|uniref:Uncharacterized protein n=1 Tax=Dichomitus squalens TaxID=114155 RepID=A0A4V2K7J2_9APHY|nr:hypothetical protein BD310DRAFT_632367 [Dichomitus squalens]